MSFKRPLSVSPKQVACDKSRRQSNNSGICKVCGDKATIINYGALSCQSCKTFFRRNGFHPESVCPCLFTQSCEMNITTRRCCTACRLAKCFSVGMSSDLIRKEELRYRKHSSSLKSNTTEYVISKESVPKLLTSNKLDNNPSLNISEWTLVSNIVHGHDTFTSIPEICRLIERLSALPVEMQFDETYRSEIITLIYTSMQSFITSSPDFQILTASEQFSLFERNLSSISVFYFVLIFSNAVINNEPKYTDLFTTIYGTDILSQAKHINKHLDYDLTIVKLILIVFAFSSNCFIVDVHENALNDSFLHGTHRLFGSQNMYMELLWKFMIYHHDYVNSVLCFSRLMGFFLNLIQYSIIAYRNNTAYHELVNNVFKNAKQSLITNQNKQVQLWGKI